ncbi:MAG: ThuA domain-containing protein [Planctomycetaceae bacterium]
MKLQTILTFLTFAITATAMPCATAADPIRALIVDGQNNHDMWPKTTFMMKRYLEQTGLFTVDVARTAYTWNGGDLVEQYPLEGVTGTSTEKPQTDPDYRPDFSKYDVVISNFGHSAAAWPKSTQEAFETFVGDGGGFVVVHAADNAFPDWPAYNRMIGLGGWGGRTEKDGPYIYTNDRGDLIRDTSAGNGGHHGVQHEFAIVVRDRQHPVTKGMPAEWLHAKDELYDSLRGPAANMNLLATAYSDPEKGGTGRHEPMMLTVTFGRGRVFHTPMGHADYSMQDVGFITTLLRGTEWAATGKVTIPIPADFPTSDRNSSRTFEK